MAKYKQQKKKTGLNFFLDILFKVLIGVAVIIFGYITYDNLKSPSVSFGGAMSNKKRDTADAPSNLKWFDHFGGVENVPKKGQKKKKSDSGGSSTGFNFKGF